MYISDHLGFTTRVWDTIYHYIVARVDQSSIIIEYIFLDNYLPAFLQPLICFPVMHILVFLRYLIITCTLYMYMYTCLNIAVKFAFLNDKKQVFILKFY